MTDRMRTGIDLLDDELGGGVPDGSIVALSASPASQSELFLYRLPRVRRTLYLTTRRSEDAVRDALESAEAPVDNAAVRTIDGDAPLERGLWFVRHLPPESTFVVDPIGPFEQASPGGYERFLNLLKTRVEEVDAVAVLHCLEGRSVPPLRDTTEYMADVVFDLETAVTDGGVENRLAVPKHRGGPAMADTMKLELEEEIAVDITRRIS